jgi:hypothetical protein
MMEELAAALWRSGQAVEGRSWEWLKSSSGEPASPAYEAGSVS